MAQKTNIGVTSTGASSAKQPTAAEMRQYYEDSMKRIEEYANAKDALKNLTDISKTVSKTISAYNKENLIDYLRNIGSNEKNLRNLSWYLYYRSQVYRRLINYNATMFCLDARSVIPNYDLTKDNDSNKMLKSYYDTLVMLNNMHLQGEFLKIYITCFVQDVFYGVVYYDETGLFILPLPADYCKIAGRYNNGDFAFALDMTYFRGTNNYLLEYWGEPFVSMYRVYESEGNNARWQIVPEEYAVCLKQEIADWQTIVPPYSGLFNELINLEDVKDVQAIADEQDIYKMIWVELATLPNAKQADEWAVDPSIAVEYFNRMVNEALPDYTSAAIVPGKIDQINFNQDKASDTNKVANATKTVLNSSGGAQILNSSTISGTTAFTAAIIADTEMAISSLLPQTEAWVNRFIGYHISTPAKVKFFEISSYTKESFRKQLLESAQHGLPTKLALNTLSGFSELDTLALNYLEEEVLLLGDKFDDPLSSTYTRSSYYGSRWGRPRSDDGDLTDDGEASREKSDQA